MRKREGLDALVVPLGLDTGVTTAPVCEEREQMMSDGKEEMPETEDYGDVCTREVARAPQKSVA
eukprot:scaffold8081_cov239-Pinguiococcus_pyrenoidosus.AAC.4